MPVNRKGWLDLLKISPGVGVFCPGGCAFAGKFCPRAGLLTTSKNSPGVCLGGMFALGFDWCIRCIQWVPPSTSRWRKFKVNNIYYWVLKIPIFKSPKGDLASGDAYWFQHYDDTISDVLDSIVDDVFLYDKGIEEAFYQVLEYLYLCCENGITIHPGKFQVCPVCWLCYLTRPRGRVKLRNARSSWSEVC